MALRRDCWSFSHDQNKDDPASKCKGAILGSNPAPDRSQRKRPNHRITARQKQQAHPQQTQAQALENLGFADSLRSARWSSSVSWSAW